MAAERRVAWALCAVLVAACDQSGDVLTDRDATVAPDVVTDDVPVETGPGATSLVVAGYGHACAIHHGALSCWGDNSGSELGVEGAVASTSLAGHWNEVVAGDGFSCAIDTDGALWCWGQNDHGELGLGDVSPRGAPTRVGSGVGWHGLAAGFAHACAIDATGALWCWGDNTEGELGQNDGSPGVVAQVPTRVGTNSDWTAVSGGQGHTCGLRAPGALWCWGRNTEGELGLGTGTPIQLRTPTRVGSDADWSIVRAGQSYSCGLKSDGTLWCWGGDGSSQLGDGATNTVLAPERVGATSDWVALSVNTFETCGVRAPGTLWCWGRNAEGQLGTGDVTDRSVPTAVGAASDWRMPAVGRFFACGGRADGSVWCTGANESGELGTGDTNRRQVMTPVVVP